MPIRLMENFRAVFYAPFLRDLCARPRARGRRGGAADLGRARRRGAEAWADRTIDVSWGGPMRVMKAHDQDRHSPLVNFCEVVSHDPFFLIGKTRRAAVPACRSSTGNSPRSPRCRRRGCACGTDLRGCDAIPTELPRIADRAMTRNYHALKAGDLDVMQAFEPFVSMAEQEQAQTCSTPRVSRPDRLHGLHRDARGLRQIPRRIRRDDARHRRSRSPGLRQSGRRACTRWLSTSSPTCQQDILAPLDTAIARQACGRATRR